MSIIDDIRQPKSWEQPIKRMRKGDPIPAEYADMAIAWARGEITLPQIERAFHSECYSRLALGFRKAILDGTLKVDEGPMGSRIPIAIKAKAMLNGGK